MTMPPAGWYPDPGGATSWRWWNGAAWTGQVSSPAPGPVVRPRRPVVWPWIVGVLAIVVSGAVATVFVGGALLAILVVAEPEPRVDVPELSLEERGDQAPEGLAEYYTQELAWESCAQGECAWLTVPLDYEDPSGDTIRLRVARTQASDSKVGSLVVNPGGPGGSGVGFAEYVAESIAPNVAKAYDIVGFDPRGVGESAPVECLDDAETSEFIAADGTPDTPEEQEALLALVEDVYAGCVAESADLLEHVGTDSTVRDMDVLRAALGESELDWLGFSYGTYLGARYAEQFPERVGRFVLDGAVDPTLTSDQMGVDQAVGFADALSRFAADCVQYEDCPYAGEPGEVLAGINDLLARLDATPMNGPDGRVLSQSEGMTAVVYSMYSTLLWPVLREGLSAAEDGDAEGLLALSDAANSRVGDRYEDNSLDAFFAISCLDFPVSSGPEDWAEQDRVRSQGAPVPELERALAWSSAVCSGWPTGRPASGAPVSAATKTPILVIGTTHDPATPLKWAQGLARQLDNSFLLTYDGDGHTAYDTTSGSACVASIVDDYLLSGNLPEGTQARCP